MDEKELDAKELDRICPKLSELELAIALDTCRKAGAVNAANALNRHITRLQIENQMLKKDKVQ